jgi:hypothetical protein
MDTTLRFWQKVDKNGPIPEHRPALGPCWIWTGGKTPKGYGLFYTRTGTVYAHRYANELTNGVIPEGQHVLHHCDTPPCCNPSHHFRGTPSANSKDMAAKGRHHIPHGTHDQKFQKGSIRISGRWWYLKIREDVPENGKVVHNKITYHKLFLLSQHPRNAVGSTPSTVQAMADEITARVNAQTVQSRGAR